MPNPEMTRKQECGYIPAFKKSKGFFNECYEH